jgi:PAS domain S-box-containing protein
LIVEAKRGTMISRFAKSSSLEHALSESEHKYQALVETTDTGYVILDSEGTVIDANQSYLHLTGRGTFAEILGVKVTEWTAPHDLSRNAEEVRKCLEIGRVRNLEIDYVDLEGNCTPIEINATVVETSEGVRILTLCKDITDRQAAAEALRRNEEERHQLEAEIQHAQQVENLGSLAGGVAHDMNNVLQAIQGMASVLKVKFSQDPAVVSGLDIILNASSRGRDLVKSLTGFARKGLQAPQFFDLNQIIRKEVELLQHTTLQRIELQVELGDALPQILGDPSSIGNSLMNLCVNAVDAMPEKGVLRFLTRRLDSGAVELVVEDTGHGMPPEVLAHAAEPFFTTKPAGKGTGLGLSGVSGTMKAHGGAMEIQSEVGKGTRVILRFQGAEGSSTPAVSPTASPSNQRPEKPLKILLIDDDELIRDSFPELMEILGHKVVATASHGQDGLRQIEEGLAVDVIVLDQNMPGLSGIETLTRLRAMRPELPIVFCTGHLEDSVRDKLHECTRVWTLMKPYSIKDIRPILSGAAQG